jgi:hypothetical protein
MTERKARIRLDDLHIDDRVLLAGDHPHAGKLGRVKGRKLLAMTSRLGVEIALDAGGGCFVFSDSDVVALDHKGYPR